MYGSPAKSAARERDSVLAELERECALRMRAEETINSLHAELERARRRARQRARPLRRPRRAIDERGLGAVLGPELEWRSHTAAFLFAYRQG